MYLPKTEYNALRDAMRDAMNGRGLQACCLPHWDTTQKKFYLFLDFINLYSRYIKQHPSGKTRNGRDCLPNFMFFWYLKASDWIATFVGTSSITKAQKFANQIHDQTLTNFEDDIRNFQTLKSFMENYEEKQ